MDNNAITLFFWGFLIVYGVGMFFLAPRAKSTAEFFKGSDSKGRQVSPFVLTASIFVSWVMAKSVTNCINLGAQFGIVGGIAYALYWVAIPLAGFVIYRLRKRFGFKSLVSFLTSNYGKGAALAFTLAILIRLYNEVWSNSSVAAGYFGASGSTAFIVSALFFTVIALAYSIKGGMRSSLFTDVVQFVLQAGIMIAVIVLVFMLLGNRPALDYLNTGVWTLETGVDLLLVTCLQIFSYPFHDPVLTDRAFLTDVKSMLKVYVISGVLGFIAILLTSLVGINAAMAGIPVTGNVPAEIAQALGGIGHIVIGLLMVVAAGTTLDSTFTSLAKVCARDIPWLRGRNFGERARKVGIGAMLVFAVLGNAPMLFGTDVLLATTISGTMVMGMGPVFCLYGVVKPTQLGFHLSFWIGIASGVLYTVGLVPDFAYIGEGKYAAMLGVNLYGLILCTLGYLVPGVVASLKDPTWKEHMPKPGDDTYVLGETAPTALPDAAPRLDGHALS